MDQLLEKLDQFSEKVRRLEEGMAAISTPSPAPAPIASPPHVGASPRPAQSASVTPAPAPEAIANLTPTPTRESIPNPTPTPNPSTSVWVQQRLGAVISLYSLTETGAALVRSLDIRQMKGAPGFFGSYGFNEWAGVGEAKPIGVIHEVSHSYWGGFPVEGFPELGWDAPPGRGCASGDPTLPRRYPLLHGPPSRRLRSVPPTVAQPAGPVHENSEPLLHNSEGDLVYNTGGNLALVPPILRKYSSRFLRDGTFASWYEAVAWFQSLNGEDRATAGKYLGFEHMDLRHYGHLDYPEDGIDLISPWRQTLVREGQQRLFDLADQFDMLLGHPQKEENFQFWSGYLRDKVQLHRSHPDYLASLELPRAADMASALGFMVGLEGTVAEGTVGPNSGPAAQRTISSEFLALYERPDPAGTLRQRGSSS